MDTSAGAEKLEKMPLSNPTGKVDAGTFENILNGKLPDGSQVGEPGKRAVGMDLTFSMPKSATLLSLVGGDTRITQAHMGAVKTAMGWVEANLAEGRQKIDGRAVPVRTGNLVYALFQHDTSRALDPQGHVHAVIANMTRMPDGNWRALHNGEIWRNNTVISSIYHAAFRDSLEKLGYAVQLQGKHGTFEIAGVPKNVREAFSQRRADILAKATELGTATKQGLREITKRTRDDKIAVEDRGALTQEWKARAADLGFVPEQLIEQAKVSANKEAGLLERGVGAIEDGLKGARQFVLDSLQKPSDPLVDTALKRVMMTGPVARTQLATASAIRILSQREAAFEVHQVTKTAVDLGLNGVTPELIDKRLIELTNRGELVPGDNKRADNVVEMVTTRDALETEAGILGEIERGKNGVLPLVRPDRAVEVLSGASKERPLNDGQMAAASTIIASSDRIVAVQGLAGAGKSTMLGAVANVLDFEKKPALGLAFQNKMVADLKEVTGLEAMTVASFLMQHDALLTGDHPQRASKSRDMLNGAYLIVDEASMISNNQMHALTQIANVASVDKLVLVGDRKQLLSIDAGKSFAVAQAGGLATADMNENLRQRTPELRAVAALTNVGRAGNALKLLGDRVIETNDRVETAAEYWLNLPEDERDKTMLFTSGRETRANLNEHIQTGLKDEGKLKGGGLKLTVADRVDRTREELRYAHSYQPGFRLEVWTRLQSVGLERGEYRVSRVFQNGKVEVERNRKRKAFDPQKLASGAKLDKLNLTATKEIEVHEGDKIRWTANDKTRDLLNSSIGRVVGIDGSGVMVERGDKSVVRLGMDDPMLKRIDLAYALNMHMAQGITTDKGLVVMGSEERYLSNQRLFNVAVTRVRDDVKVITDDKEKLGRQLNRTTGDKYSALEEAGRLDVDKHKIAARDPDKPFDPGSLEGLGLADDKLRAGPPSESKPEPPRQQTPAKQGNDEKAVQPLSLPEKSKGMEL
ncbi:MobF family relaxase [Sphingorhabdus sp. YGSMI21]|uniref:MobF family relaxase n=1 Tax=Sphingorhabdus sp. YGSMI21 TaxID=2077182 RepID=UPI0013D9C946|nr:MobF family relaxase [Sphingorhabdus sp. YGSMI21]